MKDLLYKELKLAAMPLSYVFIAGALLTLVPGYPILLGAFFPTLGIFYSFQTMRENSDIGYSLLLPVTKADVVKCKYAFCVFVELCSFLVMMALTLIRMTLLNDAAAYAANALMGANLVFLGFALLIFALFNLIFVSGFFRTAYYYGKPFIIYAAVTLIVIAAAETLHHIPGLDSLNSFGFTNMQVQLPALLAGAAAYVLLTLLAVRSSVRKFEMLDM